MEKKNRDRLDILADILILCQEPRKRREISEGCRLKGKQAAELIIYLVDGGFLKKMSLKECDIYLTTLQGSQLLQQYHKLKQLLNVKNVAVATH